ncbi:hypothetical protein [Acidianus bottle-shaped virus 3 strain ABV3]|uniref:Uncharacterized protein n=1 Tax=Acidianus bottle-shaped virus 3 strain ABV3 TaxID=1732174 RepID=A0A0N9PCQ6_9VIRU|nr:hypothetical protein AVU00_gp36 [Acidianus bottle-shaped virus 3 strain ABV3]ALG96838.1 hypothetical protein [Acidianus bottle-shaped virus 3 strain ABV3]
MPDVIAQITCTQNSGSCFACYLLAITEIVYGIIKNNYEMVGLGIVTFIACKECQNECPIPPYYCCVKTPSGNYFCGNTSEVGIPVIERGI